MEYQCFENLSGSELDGWLREKSREIFHFCKASDGKWDDDRIAIAKSRCDELQEALRRKGDLLLGEKSQEISDFCAASDGEWDFDRIAIASSRCDELREALRRKGDSLTS
jgi:hypothetical protein